MSGGVSFGEGDRRRRRFKLGDCTGDTVPLLFVEIVEEVDDQFPCLFRKQPAPQSAVPLFHGLVLRDLHTEENVPSPIPERPILNEFETKGRVS